MKKLFLILFGFVAMSAFASNDRPVTFDQLPQKAQQFINQHFSKVGFLSAKFDEGTYEVTLVNGTEIDFTSQGDWKDVDCHTSAVPAAIVPAAISKYVKAQYPSNLIVKIEKKRNGYDIELNNDLDLVFDQKGNFIRIDN